MTFKILQLPDSPVPRFAVLWLPVFLWCVLIFSLSHIPHLRITQSDWDMLLRKIAHMVEYGTLTLLVFRALAGSTQWSMRKLALWAIIFSVFYASTDEYHQTFIVGRHGSPKDVLIDSAGIFAAAIFRQRFPRTLWR